MTKDALRKLYLQKRQALTEADYAQLNFQLYQNFFFNVDLSFINVLHTFLPLQKNKEPDTWIIVDRIRREFPHVRLVVPRIEASSGTLENIFFEGLHQIEKNKWDIPEPKQGVPAASEKIDMVLVPLLACDERGQRVGYGKGFYDKFLATCRPDCKTVGISFFEPVERIDDVNALDVPLQHCLTPTAFHTFA
ncbi:5-formyltetrahydrofolate cyclo-ligase [Chryseolinea lacunae]|uniref:5-formyltetrahydrofolate cyclo-ligase n=1 Tax=Chryseolinea lacunae TaxID=2801331 RepID=A0ABS1KQS7_9BACT|nr:5-formyltetrahydrofolate cyclo-ligase [Chryseolinea lacunae]MBL0741553.1 5-formyltetrahydrofolate cyclo-ligase [Chryseolinea lacunae]